MSGVPNNWKSSESWNTPAPGDLELVRQFVNTLKIPKGMSEEVDDLPSLLDDSSAWSERFPEWTRDAGDNQATLESLRSDLRAVLGDPESWSGRLDRWFEEYPLIARVSLENREAGMRYDPVPGTGFVGRVLAVVAQSIGDGTFVRLKACRDCRWVFYDTSRSKTRVWCGMYAGENGRACGTIAKVKRYRRKRQSGQ